MFDLDMDKLEQKLNQIDTTRNFGHINRVIGLVIESIGPHASIGEICLIKSDQGDIKAEVVGFDDNKILMMPIGEMEGIKPGARVVATGEKLKINVGEHLLGKIIDGSGNVLNGSYQNLGTAVEVNRRPPDPLKRRRIKQPLSLGVRCIDGFLTCGKGQRLGIFAGSGVGKSTLLGMAARNTNADINVIALVGERGREVRDFIEKDLGEEGLKRSIVVVATSDQPALLRVKAANIATAIAEYFRDQSEDVLLMMDSVTRVAMALREVGLAIGEPPATRGYPPSVFAELPKLLERTGTNDLGSITALYTVLVEGDDFNEPVSDTVRGILDGHISLSRELAESGHYPAVDVLSSVSRIMNDLVDKDHLKAAEQVQQWLAAYNKSEDLINIGAYEKGSNPEVDKAIEKIGQINSFLRQDIEEKANYQDSVSRLKKIASN
ncbi:type III secretion system ATPase, FliI/YscN [Halanaerobium congolense]|uniref:Type III secretion system ATPase, FliI/YscN n=1 Tax=Halanaerobium congolense TaxID=54121 RepID=A0A1G6S3L8_9FIRM|nr:MULTISPECIES: flagellar protein export ATPase FliI [Halanaerobium]KXS49967.1 MAG: flagellum-specific ATP synthase [Halanaerobium sp. T82-1]PTX16511.1 type III secretion system FliI/YscN family ATPase [Halanaerobium congolense]PUU89067.1 MAG: flagellum-specific ATP synthase [Halanaerobium sp.]PUU92842.1 MAG: Flagellum-specific ATP synthase FliI [Halanaerobium sp.]TDP26351.1 type III secretion system FliI/YscN family ATPase [Halanaerobium congolense]